MIFQSGSEQVKILIQRILISLEIFLLMCFILSDTIQDTNLNPSKTHVFYEKSRIIMIKSSAPRQQARTMDV